MWLKQDRRVVRGWLRIDEQCEKIVAIPPLPFKDPRLEMRWITVGNLGFLACAFSVEGNEVFSGTD